jgi:outer membrane lipoprotein-sorting protein
MSDPLIEDGLNEIGQTLQQQRSVRDAVMRRVTEASLNPPAAARGSPSRRRMIVRVAAIAACAVIATLLWSTRGGGIGAQEAFAAAIEKVDKARTFSARTIHRWMEDGQPKVSETLVMFREPNQHRMENIKGLPAQVVITDYEVRKQLVLLPENKTGQLQDISTQYSVDDKTGRVKLSELWTGERDEVLKFSAQAVKDVGREKLDGKDVRVLRSADGGEPVKTVWVNPDSGAPMQIGLSWPSRKSTYTFASIRIDEDLDDSLFSLEPPKGYAMEAPPVDPRTREAREHDGKMLVKARDVVMACYKYADKKGDFPEQLADLKGVVMEEAALTALLAAPDEPEGPPVLVYRKPRKGKDAGEEIVVYEAPEHRRAGHVVAAMWDGHAQLCTEEYFNKLMK